MPSTIITKNGSGAPLAADLVAGELAVDLTNGRLYTEDTGGSVIEIGLNPSGNVDVTGTVTADGLTVDSGSTNTQLTLARSTTHSGISFSTQISDFGGGGADLIFDGSGNSTGFGFRPTNSSGTLQTGLVISPDGNVGIGTDSPSRLLELKTTTATDSYLRISGTSGNAADTNFAGIEFYNLDGSGLGPNVASFIEARAETSTGAGGELVFATSSSSTSASEAMRIDSSGNLLVGRTTSFSSSRTEIQSSGSGGTGASECLSLNNTGADGNMLEFYKSGTTVGSIGTKSGDLTIGTGDTGVQFYDFGNSIVPTNLTTNTNIDATIDLGLSGTRFKDLYLSGGVNQSTVLVSALPAAASSTGYRFMVSDSTVAASGNFGATVAGSGSNVVPVFSDGTNWLIG